MALTSLDELTPEVREVVVAYLEGIARALPVSVRSDVMENVTSDLLEALSPHETPVSAAEVIVALHSPEDFAQYGVGDARHRIMSGSLLGVPYDLRAPHIDRFADRWWNTADSRILVPKAFGIGWTVNFGAVARHLHLIEPDAEDRPFGATPRAALVGGIPVPLVMCATMVVSRVVLADLLPDRLPSHWGFSGRPDEFTPATDLFWIMFAFAAIPTAWAVIALLTGRSSRHTGIAIGAASLFSALAASIWALSLVNAVGGLQAWWLPVFAVLAPLGVPLLVMLGMARAGRAADIARSLSRGSEEE